MVMYQACGKYGLRKIEKSEIEFLNYGESPLPRFSSFSSSATKRVSFMQKRPSNHKSVESLKKVVYDNP